MGLAQQEIAAMEGALAEFNKSRLVETHFPLWISCVVAVSIIVTVGHLSHCPVQSAAGWEEKVAESREQQEAIWATGTTWIFAFILKFIPVLSHIAPLDAFGWIPSKPTMFTKVFKSWAQKAPSNRGAVCPRCVSRQRGYGAPPSLQAFQVFSRWWSLFRTSWLWYSFVIWIYLILFVHSILSLPNSPAEKDVSVCTDSGHYWSNSCQGHSSFPLREHFTIFLFLFSHTLAINRESKDEFTKNELASRLSRGSRKTCWIADVGCWADFCVTRLIHRWPEQSLSTATFVLRS